MPKAAPAAGTGTPVSGDHSNAMELTSPVKDEDITTPVGDPENLGSHREDEDAPADGSDDGSDEIEVPTRLKGKPLAQVYKEFSGLEKDRSRLANEVGEARALLRQALEQALKQPGATPATDEEPDPTDEDFDTNPREASTRLIKKATKPLERALATAEQRAVIMEFNTRHPGYIEEAASPEFQEWVKASPFRLRTFKAASEFDVEAAEDLFTEWESRRPVLGSDDPDPADKKREAIRRNRTETGGAGKSATGKSGKPIYKATELMRLYTQDRERYNSMADEIRLAFAEGRVR